MKRSVGGRADLRDTIAVMHTGVQGNPIYLPSSSERVGVFEHIVRATRQPLRASAHVHDFAAGAGRHLAEFRGLGRSR